MRSIMALFRPKANDVAGLYQALVAEARSPGWYVEGGAADSMTGRFAVLASLTALAVLRLEQGGEEGVRASAALTEAFIADLEPQLRVAGLGDPTLGKEVRRLVGALANRTDRFRAALDGQADWNATAVDAALLGEPASEAAATYAAERLKSFAEHLAGFDDRAIIEGRLS